MSATISHLLTSINDPHSENRTILVSLNNSIDFWLHARYVENDPLALDLIYQTIIRETASLQDKTDKLEKIFLSQVHMKGGFEFLESEYEVVTREVLLQGFGEEDVKTFSSKQLLLWVLENRDASRKKFRLLSRRVEGVGDFFNEKISADGEIGYHEIKDVLMGCLGAMVKMEKARRTILELEAENRGKMVRFYTTSKPEKKLAAVVRTLRLPRRYKLVPWWE